MDDVLRRSAAHVLVADVTAPALDDATAHHLRRVLRLRDGERLTVTDGAGRWRACLLAGGAIEADGSIERSERPVNPTTVAVAAPKGERLEWLVQKCTEIGVDDIVVLMAERSVVRWEGERGERQLERLQRIAGEAAMQSRRLWLPTVSGPLAASAILPGAVVAEPDGRPMSGADTVVAIGPEGGWSPAELALATDRVSLGPNILRVETAAVVAAALMTSLRSAVR